MQTGIGFRCPKCYSARIVVDKQGAAPSVADHISLLEGTVDHTPVRFTCLQCGASFAPSEAKMAQDTGLATTTGALPAHNNAVTDKQHILDLYRDQGALTAVKYLHDTYSWSLKEAKDYVDRLHTPATTTTPATEEAMILQLVQQGGKLSAIKYCKDTYNMGLKEAKDYVEGLMTARGIAPVSGGKTGCFVATACYGDYDAPEVKILRSYRDRVLHHSAAGRLFIRIYYTLSPPLAAHISKAPRTRAFIRHYLLGPLVRRIAREPA